MNREGYRWPILAGLVFLGLLSSSCGAGNLLPVRTQAEQVEGGSFLFTPTLTPFQPSPPTPIPFTATEIEASESPFPELPPGEVVLTSTQTAALQEDPPIGIYLPSYIPQSFKDSITLPAGYGYVDEQDRATYQLVIGDQNIVSLWVYTLVAPFPTIPNGVGSEELYRIWQGIESSTFPSSPLLMDPQTYAVFETTWGPSAPGVVAHQEAFNLANYAWENRPTWGIVPFESLEPSWKVLEIDGNSPIRKDFNPAAYPLLVPFSLEKVSGSAADPSSDTNLHIPVTNREAGKMTTLAMTGVTAMVRCTAYYMEQRGITYPGQDIRDILREADITHISNEIPFAEGCPFPNCLQEGLVFCSDPKYMELLTDIGTDIVELTGDHFADWGPEAMYYTLELYKDHGLPYYGGGIDWEEGSRAVTMEHNGNRLAFIGCNGKGRGYATASVDNPGAVWCDFEKMHAEIAKLRAEEYIPVATFQHFEYYTYRPQPNMQADFRGMAEAGAFIVSGSQAHQPHGMELLGDSFLHYGLGNLFFDQFGFCPERACDDAFIDRHVIYDGRYISTELIPIKFIDWARPRPMTAEESAKFLEDIFEASGW
jgi:hypothetical protein